MLMFMMFRLMEMLGDKVMLLSINVEKLFN